MISPSFAASFFAAFFVLPRPQPTQRPSTMACTTYSGMLAHVAKTAIGEQHTQIGVVLDPSPALSLYTHSTSFDSCAKHWLNNAKCPTLASVYCAMGGEAHTRDEVADFAGGSPAVGGGSPYSFRIIRYDSSKYGRKRARSHDLTASSPWSRCKPPR